MDIDLVGEVTELSAFSLNIGKAAFEECFLVEDYIGAI